MPQRLVLIAHAATRATRQAAFANGEALDEKGIEVARGAGRFLPTATMLLTSPALAARQTATALDEKARDWRVEDRLRDLDVGVWAGRSLRDIGEEVASWVADSNYAGHGGESLASFLVRIREWLSTALAMPGTTVAMTHAAVVRAAVLAVLDAPPAAFWRIDAAPLTALTLSSDGRRWAMRAFRALHDCPPPP